MSVENIFSCLEGQEQLLHKIESVFKQGSLDQIVRITVPIEATDPLQWLSWQEQLPKLYWRDRSNEFEMAGIGIADKVSANQSKDFDFLFHRLRNEMASTQRSIRYYGGICFDRSAKKEKMWQPYGSYHFVLPLIELFRGSEGTHLVCNIKPCPDSKKAQEFLKIKEMVERIRWKEGLPALRIQCLNRRDIPDKEQWTDNINRVLSLIRLGQVQKVVMSRCSEFECEESVPAVSLLHSLSQGTKDCFHFYYQFEEGNAFLGASPERLYHRKERYIRSEALAGTRPRSFDEDKDRKLSIELLSSQKEELEHRLVVNEIKHALEPLSRSLSIDRDASLIKLKRGQHLFSGFQGLLNSDVSDASLLKSLHPTPAVGGHPRGVAIDLIDQMEPYERGWYTGPVGWVAYDAVEFAVAIRCALVKDKYMYLFSGAGIVNGSEAQAEWMEIENKIANFLELMNEMECSV